MNGNLGKFRTSYQDGSIIFNEYELGESFFFIEKGSVRLTKKIGNTVKILAILDAGDIFGEMSIIESSPRSATASAVGGVSLLQIGKSNFESIVLSNPQLIIRLVHTFVLRIWDQRQKLRIYSYRNPRERVLCALSLLARPINNEEIPADLKSIISHPEKARKVVINDSDMVGWTGVSLGVCRNILARLNQLQRITVKSGKVFIHNIDDIEQLLQIADHTA